MENQTQTEIETEKKLKTTLDEETTKRYETVKKHTGMHSDKSVLEFLISQEYNRIERLKLHKVFLPKETYSLVEKAAETRGQTIDEYVEELTEDMLRKAKEGVTHAEN